MALYVQSRQTSHNLHRLHAYGDHTAQQVKRVAGISYRFYCIAVGIVGNAAGGVFLDTLTFHHPFDGRFSVYHVVICCFWNVCDGDVAVVDDRGLVLGLATTAEPHLGDVEEGLWIRNVRQPQIALSNSYRVRFNGFIAHVSSLRPAALNAQKSATVFTVGMRGSSLDRLSA